MRKLRSYLWQGDISDLRAFHSQGGQKVAEKYGITLAIHVGHTPFVPFGFPTIYLPMMDESGSKANDWPRIIRALLFAVDEIRHGGNVIVVCDAGISRSVVFSAMLISLAERREMDDLRNEIGGDPLDGLWNSANGALKDWLSRWQTDGRRGW